VDVRKPIMKTKKKIDGKSKRFYFSPANIVVSFFPKFLVFKS
jgi:hypothetical protein